MRLSLLLLLAITLPSCATIINDDFMAIPVDTNYPAATVQYNGQTHTTPTVLSVPRGLGDQKLIFTKDGQDDPPVVLKESISPVIFVNAIFALAGIVLAAIDTSNPRGYTLHPNPATYNFHTHQFEGIDRGPATAGADAWDGP